MEAVFEPDKYEELKGKIRAMRILENENLKQKYKEMHLKIDESAIMLSGLFLFCRGMLRAVVDKESRELVEKYDKLDDGLEELEGLFRKYNHAKWMKYKYEKMITEHISGKEIYMKTLINFAMGLFAWD